MHRTILALAALVAVRTSSALAQAEDAPRWTIGAGFSGVAEVFLLAPSTPSLLSGTGTSVPTATVFLERRIGERRWLGFAAAGDVRSDSFDPPSGGLSVFGTVTDSEVQRGSLSVGVRQVMTRPGATVDVSLLGSVTGGYVHLRQGIVSSLGSSEIEDTGGFASASAGIAVERVLTGALALRISTPLVGFTWSRAERKEGSTTRDGSSAGASIGISPRLELRLAF